MRILYNKLFVIFLLFIYLQVILPQYTQRYDTQVQNNRMWSNYFAFSPLTIHHVILCYNNTIL